MSTTQKILVSLLCLQFCYTSIKAQNEVQRYVLLEKFTNTFCPPCIQKNPVFYENILTPYEDNAIFQISYHTPTPLPDDIFYQHNPNEPIERQEYYTAIGTPRVYMQGKQVAGGTEILPVATLQTTLGKTSPIQVLVTEEQVANNRKVKVKIKTVGEKPVGEFSLRLVVVEKLVEYEPPYEGMEIIQHNVFRKFINGSQGQTFFAPPTNITSGFTFSYELDSIWKDEEVYVIAFVQNEENKEVLNVGSSWGKVSVEEEVTSPIDTTNSGNEPIDSTDMETPIEPTDTTDTGEQPIDSTEVSEPIDTINTEEPIDTSTTTAPTDTIEQADTLSTYNNSSLLVEQLQIFPNPTTDYITISLARPTFEPKGIKISLFDLNGKLWNNMVIDTPSIQLPIQHLPSGLFFIQIRWKDGIIIRKMIKE